MNTTAKNNLLILTIVGLLGFYFSCLYVDRFHHWPWQQTEYIQQGR